jgi:hypothetical protein
MTHIRKQIRDAVATVLTGLTTTETRVFVSRVYPMERTSLPGIIIMTASDELMPENSTGYAGGVSIMSNLQLIVKAYAKNTTHVENNLDQIEMEVREALANAKTLGGLSRDINWVKTDIDLEANGEEPVGVAEMLFNIGYRVKDNALGSAIT